MNNCFRIWYDMWKVEIFTYLARASMHDERTRYCTLSNETARSGNPLIRIPGSVLHASQPQRITDEAGGSMAISLSFLHRAIWGLEREGGFGENEALG